MKPLPYYRWYPADAETDSVYASLNDAELGFYHRCLNRAWLNGGIPSNLDDLAAAFRRSRKSLDRVWPKVSSRWVTSKDDPALLVNPRQEKEREYARTKSERNTDAVRTRYERSSNVVQHARARADCVSECDSASDFGNLKNFPAQKLKTVTAPMSHRFEEYWALQPGKTMRKDLAAAVWAHEVTTDNEEALFACLARYLASAEVARGTLMNPENWLSACAAGNFTATWPARASPKTKQELSAEAWDRA